FRLDQLVVHALHCSDRQHARGQVNAYQFPRKGPEQRSAPAAPAAEIEHIEAAVLHTTLGAVESEQDLRHAVAEALHVSLVTLGVTVEDIKEYIVRQTLRDWSLAQRGEAHRCDSIGGGDLQASPIPSGSFVRPSCETQNSPKRAIRLEVARLLAYHILQTGDRQFSVAFLERLFRMAPIHGGV